jgi:hypothetical protein
VAVVTGEDDLPSIEELTGPARDPGEALEQARRNLGISSGRIRNEPDRPDVGDLRAELGL